MPHATIKEIIERKKQGIDSTEAESAEIKGFIKENLIQVGTGEVQLVEEIQEHFPIEYGEAIDEMEKMNKGGKAGKETRYPFTVIGSKGNFQIVENKVDGKVLPSSTVEHWTGKKNKFNTQKDAIKAMWVMYAKMHGEQPAYNLDPKEMEKGGKAGALKVKSVYKYAMHSNTGETIDYDKFVRLTDADVYAQAKPLSAQELKDILNEIEPDEELDKFDEVDDIVEYLRKMGILACDNTYNRSYWGNAIIYCTMELENEERLVFLAMHISGDVRGNYKPFKAYRFDHIEDEPYYNWKLYVEIKTNKGEVTLDAEDDEAYHFVVGRDENDLIGENESIDYEGIKEKLGVDIWMKEGGAVAHNFLDYYANHGAVITGGSYFNAEQKGVGGLLAGLALGAVGGYYYRDKITSTKEKAKGRIVKGITALACGGEMKMRKGGVAKDGDRHAYYIKAWKKGKDNIDNKKADYIDKKSLNWDEAKAEQEKLEAGGKYDAVGIYAKKDNREVSISLSGLKQGGKVSDDRIEKALRSYAYAGLWTTPNEEDGDSEFLDGQYGIDDIAPDTMESMRRDVRKFYEENIDLLNQTDMDDGRIGHNFWLNKNHHGSGFWDEEGLDKAIGKKLSDASQKFKENLLVVGDDGKIHDEYKNS